MRYGHSAAIHTGCPVMKAMETCQPQTIERLLLIGINGSFDSFGNKMSDIVGGFKPYFDPRTKQAGESAQRRGKIS
ncbi:MAG: hypothetical protein SRB2_00542 [Desulfobacteraceae bacterium Eth-SRB2]|nr:MAG: hypothetical protein SRB2_00542 [Desulfobacteraceae bacterium Eth-SRB2]